MKISGGMQVRSGKPFEAPEKVGIIESITETEVNIRWFEKSMLDSKTESVSFADPRLNQIELLTLTHGWTSMADASNAEKGTTRSLVDDLRSLLSEEVEVEAAEVEEDAEPVEEAAEVAEASGKSLEKKAREKRKEKKGGGGHNPFKTKSRLGPGPRNGQNSQTKKWKCSCTTPYKCNCRNKDGRTKVIRIKRGYKKSYNADYKQWRKSQKF